MSAIKLLAGLTTRSLSIDNVGGGGTTQLSWEVVAAGLSNGLPPLAADLALMKYCDHRGLLKRCATALAKRFTRHCEKHGWPTRHACALTLLALSEWLNEPVCRRCDGTGHTAHNAKVIDCPSCHGTGRDRLPLHTRAKLAGMGKTQFCTVWEQRMMLIAGWIEDANQQALAHLVAQCRDAEA